MTDTQKLTVRELELRSRLNEIAGIEELTDELRAEEGKKAAELKDVQTRLHAALLAEGEPDGEETRSEEGDAEGRELRSLIDGADLGQIADAAFGGSTEGETRELQEHFGLAANELPLEMLETRDVTAAPTNAGRSQAEVLQPVFAASSAAFLNIAMPTVPVGDRVYPVLGTRPTVGGPHVDSTSVSETTGSFTATSLAPQRLQASFFYRATDALRFAGMDAALREALSGALGEALDAQVIGWLFGDTGGTAHLADHNVSAETTLAGYLNNFAYGRVDGRWARDVKDLKVLLGAATYGHAGAQYVTNGERNAAQLLAEAVGGVRVSAHVPAVASSKQEGLIRLGMRRDAVCPLWRKIRLIVDEITKAATGEIVLTAVAAYNFAILRAGGFYKQQTQHGS